LRSPWSGCFWPKILPLCRVKERRLSQWKIER